MPFEQPFPIARSAEESENDKKKGIRNKAAAAALVGALAHAPDAQALDAVDTSPNIENTPIAQMEAENPDGPVTIENGRAILYSDHKQGKRLPQDPEDVNEEYQRKLMEAGRDHEVDFRTDYEKRRDDATENVQKGLQVDKAMQYTRGKLNEGLEYVLNKTGADASPNIRLFGDMAIKGVVAALEGYVSGKISERIERAISKAHGSVPFEFDERNPENMVLKKTFQGGQHRFEWTVGADIGWSDGKVDPRAGINFKMPF